MTTKPATKQKLDVTIDLDNSTITFKRNGQRITITFAELHALNVQAQAAQQQMKAQMN